MNYNPQGWSQGPSRETIWLQDMDMVTGVSGSDANVSPGEPISEEEQPDEVADLRPLGERARHAVQ